MRYGYKLFPNEDDSSMIILHNDHCNVLAATLNIVLWNLCRQDGFQGFWNRAVIFNDETKDTLYTILPDETIANLERERDENRAKWDEVLKQLTTEDWKKKTPLYKKLAPSLKEFKTNDERIVNAQYERVKEIEKTLCLEV